MFLRTGNAVSQGQTRQFAPTWTYFTYCRKKVGFAIALPTLRSLDAGASWLRSHACAHRYT